MILNLELHPLTPQLSLAEEPFQQAQQLSDSSHLAQPISVKIIPGGLGSW